MSDKDHEVIQHADAGEPLDGMHPIVKMILAKDPTAETLEKVLATQREYERDRQKRAFTAALVELKKDLPPFILRDKEVKFDKNSPKVEYTHASLANVYEIVNPILADHGFCLSGKPEVKNGQVFIKARLTHHAGHSEEAELSAAPDTKGSKNPAQAVGSTMTALIRYAGLCLLGLATKDMDDENDMGRAAVGPASDEVDVAKNLKAMGALVAKGLKKEDIEKQVGRPVQEWTTADVDKLREKYFPKATPAAATPALAPAREPGEDADEDLGANLDFHCTVAGCGYHTADESLFVDHQLATGHQQQAPANQKAKGGKSK